MVCDRQERGLMKISKLCICRPFLPTEETDKMDCKFYFISKEYIDFISIKEVCRAYGQVYIEENIYREIEDRIDELNCNVIRISNIVRDNPDGNINVRVAFLASSDTHVQFMQKLASQFQEYMYLIPDRRCKDDSAAGALEKEGEKFIEIHYQAKECRELLEFEPQYVFCAADWTSEYLAVERVIKGTNIKIISLQEGPQDWHCKFWQRGELKVSNHYRNADIIFSTGAKTMNYIKPKYFAVTGNPKISTYERLDWPDKPKVLINCNFTYVATKPPYEQRREQWMQSVLKVCKKVGIDYFISKHPRDLSEWVDEPVINSNAYMIKGQIESSSICISRFSSISYEALSMGRQSIYYNIHLEPMPIFQDEEDSAIMCIDNEEELEKVLEYHMKNYPPVIDDEKNLEYLNRHIAKLDGKALERVIVYLQEIAKNQTVEIAELTDKVGNMEEVKSAKEKELLLIKESNVAIVMGNREDEGAERYKKCLELAEELSDNGNKVFLITSKYEADMAEYRKYERHQRIEVVLTKDYDINFDSIPIGTFYITPYIAKKEDYMTMLQEHFENADQVFNIDA